jgi:hypothetical protein
VCSSLRRAASDHCHSRTKTPMLLSSLCIWYTAREAVVLLRCATSARPNPSGQHLTINTSPRLAHRDCTLRRQQYLGCRCRCEYQCDSRCRCGCRCQCRQVTSNHPHSSSVPSPPGGVPGPIRWPQARRYSSSIQFRTTASSKSDCDAELKQRTTTIAAQVLKP